MNSKLKNALYRGSTIVASGFGAGSLALWTVQQTASDVMAGQSLSMATSMVVGMATLAGAGCAHAYFAGGDDRTKDFEKIRQSDSITGILSRAGVEVALPKLVESVKAEGSKDRCFLISLDFDELRDINESYGSEIGDDVLKVMAKRLTWMVGDNGVLGRTNGSEYIVAIKTSADEREIRAAAAALIEEVSKPVAIGSTAYPVYASAGVVEILKQSETADQLIKKANLARAHAKKSGRGYFAIFHPEMRHVAEYRQWIERELTKAIQLGEIKIAYQPQVELPSGKVIGYEALARWNHSEKGAISPEEFIGVAESCGYIKTLGKWILRRACIDAMEFSDDITMSVNVSTVQIEDDGFLKTLKQILKETGLPAERLELEVTESVLIKDHNEMRDRFKAITDIGVTIAIDDFGTGYSNLTNLFELDFDKIKIDKSFIDRVGKSKRQDQMVFTIIKLAASLDATIVAEGIEFEEQALALNAAGCPIMQGYFYGKPKFIDDILTPKHKIAA